MHKPRRSSRHKSDLLGKIAEQTISIIITFVLGTALVGGGGYILLQYPSEKNQLDRKQQAYADTSATYRQFNDLLQSLRSGWFAAPDRRQLQDDTLTALLGHAAFPALPAEKMPISANDITRDLSRLSSEKSRISGYVFADDFEKALQANVVNAYDAQIRTSRQLQQLLFEWEWKQPQSRLDAISAISKGLEETAGELEEVAPKLEQLKDRTETDQHASEATARELKRGATTLTLKLALSSIGVALGLALLIAVGLMANRNKSK